VSELIDEPVTTEVDIHPEDPDDDWAATGVRSGLRLHAPTAVLLALIMVAGGFWGGAIAEKHHGSTSTSGSSALSALASRFAAARTGATGTGATGTGGFGATPAATGTVIGVVGSTLDISNAAGNIVKIQLGPSTTITRTAKSSPAGLLVGDTVTVTGSTGANGLITATAVRATASGVTTGTGGAGGFPTGGGGGAGG
jgi:hypothetical protein